MSEDGIDLNGKKLGIKLSMGTYRLRIWQQGYEFSNSIYNYVEPIDLDIKKHMQTFWASKERKLLIKYLKCFVNIILFALASFGIACVIYLKVVGLK